MNDIEPRGDTEKYVMERLASGGWTITAAQRDGADLDILVDFKGVRGRVRLRHGSNRAKAKLKPTDETSPCFVRIDLGEPSGEPEQWALWDRYKVGRGKKYLPPWYCVVVHEAIGEQWVSVAGNTVLPRGGSSIALSAETLIARAEALCPGRDTAARREAIFEVQRRNFGPQRDRRKKIVIGIVFTVIPSGLFTWALSSSLSLAHLLALGFIFALFAVPGLIVLIANLVNIPKKPLEGSRELVERIRGTGAFPVLKLSRAQHREGLPVIIHEGRNLSKGAAPLWISRISGRSRSHPIRLEADLCAVKWPSGTHEDCRLLPDRWLLVDLAGPEAEMSWLPAGPHETRRAEHIRWLFTGEELDQGLVDELFGRVVQQLPQ